MASHRHHHHHCHPCAAASTAAPTCYCYYCYTNYNQCPPPPDPHLHHLYSSQLNPPHTPHTQPHLSYHHSHFQEPYFQEEQPTHPTVSSLVRRIAALESSLHRHSSSSSSQYLRHAAARTIQTHFRAFLVRRSRTLRQLKNLASIKSTLNILKSSVSENTGFDYEALSQKATCLLLKLDCIQGDDPMIRDGKRTINRELIKFLDFIDGFCGKRREISSRVVKNVRCRGNNINSRVLQSDGKMGNVDSGVVGSVNVEKLRGLVEKIDKLSTKFDVDEWKVIEKPRISIVEKNGISQNRSGGLVKQHGGIQTKAKKSVSFAENGKVYRVLRRIQESVSNADCDSFVDGDISVDVERELEDYPQREVEEVGVTSKEAEDDDNEEDYLENGVSQCSSDGERDSRKCMRNEPSLDGNARSG
ncbi:BAG family molecular chaperone regulator 8 [Abeliophyllum distichum]|uniref:BAG family molecular chaperone regulator 8 n=1 Tax=Abeliophyllum distichum TaxID=126358 RepID=A0ABD1SX22_9LAMI